MSHQSSAPNLRPDFDLRAVILDMDGLMLDTETLAREAWFATMRHWGYDLTDETYLQVLGTTSLRTREIFREAFGDSIPIEDMYAHKQRYVDEAIERLRVAIKPGLIELLDQLDQWGVPKAVASSTVREIVLRKLGVVGLVNRFDVIICGDEVEHGKPAPDIFIEAAQRLGVPSNKCVVLEDSEVGIRAAHAAGMLPIMVPDLKPPSDEVRQLAYAVVPSLHEALILLRT